MRPLPSYAKRVEYLEATGTQWMDTGIVPSATTKMEMEGWFPALRDPVVAVRFGSRYSSNQSCFAFNSNGTNGNLRFDLGTASTATNCQWQAGSDTATKVIIDANTKYAAYVTDTGTLVEHSFTSTMTFANALPIYVFSFNANPMSSCAWQMRVSSLKIWDNGVMVRSFIPCRVNEEGMLWDEVTGAFFTNKGTSTFIVGADVRETGMLPHKLSPMGVGRRIDPVPFDAELEWVASDGSQYVDTLLNANSGLGCEIEVAFTDATMNVNSTFGDLSRPDGYTRYHASFDGTRTNITFYLGKGTVAVTSIAATPGTDFHTFVYDPTNQIASIDGTSGSTSSLGAWDTAMTFTLFARKDSNGTIGGSAQRLRKARFFRNGSLVMDLIPVRKGSDAFLFDRISKTFINVSGGTLTAGPDKSYSTNGLVMRIDGYYNQGVGQHDSSATSWVDLAGNRTVNLTRASNGWTNNSLNTKVTTGGTNATVATGAFDGIWFAENTTIEIVYKIDTPQNANGEVILFAGGFDRFAISNVEGGTAATSIIGTSPSRRVWARKDTEGNPSTIASLGTTHSIAIIFGADSSVNGWAIYSDGVNCILSDAPTGSLGVQTDGKGTIIGRTNSNSVPNNAAGQIFAMRVYNRALTADEILHHWELDKGRFQIT